MGLYDSIYAKCPNCGEEIEFQTKSGDCLMGSYTIENCPDIALANANRHAPIECDCGLIHEVDIVNRKLITKKQ